MKKTIILVFKILIGIVFAGKISNWFLDYSDETNQLLNTAMFCLIGFAFTVVGYFWDTKLIKAIFILCGLYLIGMNFLDKNTTLEIIGIICMLLPILIARFSRNETDKSITAP